MAQAAQLTASYSMPRRRNYATPIYRREYFVSKHLRNFIYQSLNTYLQAGDVVVDVGCGEQPLRSLIEQKNAQYIGVDIVQNAQKTVDVVCSATSVNLPNQSASLLLCTEVLEHVVDSAQVFAEFDRLLKPNGYVILTCPFMFGLHEEPHDYNRLTTHQITELASRYSLQPIQLDRTGNEVEVLATVVDGIFSLYTFDNQTLLLVWKIFFTGVRFFTNSIGFLVSLLLSPVLLKKYYLSNVAILQKTLHP
jgi:ubiquinone/menaquinone biosynthesis C-methylase UbiE